MELYLIQKCENEQHIDFFEQRKTIWKYIMQYKMKNLCKYISKTYKSHHWEYLKKKDSSIYFRIAFFESIASKVVGFAQEGEEKKHYNIISQSIAKYAHKWEQCQL